MTTVNYTQEGLVLQSRRKSSRSACFPSSASSTTTIPFENVLWVEKLKDSQDDAYSLAYCRSNAKKTKYTPIVERVYFKTVAEDEDISQKILQKAYDNGSIKSRKRFLVLINPHGGPGKAKSIYRKYCEPMLEAAKCKTTVVTTTHRFHAQEIARDLKLEDYDGIVCCSGDGIPHEVINGFTERPDGKGFRALREMPICQLPCGSGNSMAVSLNGNPSPTRAAWAIVKGRPMPVDLMSFIQGGDPSARKLSFLSQTYGIIADADLGTENLRWMGGQRFVVGAITRAMMQKPYPCEIYIKYAHEEKHEVEAHFHQQTTGNSSSAPTDPAPASNENEEEESPQFPLKYGTAQSEIPSDWTKLDRPDLGLFYIGKMPWVSADVMIFPATLPNDGMLDLVMWDSKMGRLEALSMLTKVEKGEHFYSEHVHYSKVEAYRLVPQIPSGYLSIDGESFPLEPFQVEVMPSAGCLLSPTGAYARTNLHRGGK